MALRWGGDSSRQVMGRQTLNDRWARLRDEGGLRHALMRRFLAAFFPVAERLGVHVTPAHFYGPVPETRDLVPGVFERRSALPGIDINASGQLDLLETFIQLYRGEYESFQRERAEGDGAFFLHNGQFETVDAEVLYCLVRYRRPRRVIEIGSGHSTRLILAALRRNRDERATCDFTAIEPFPSASLRRSLDGLGRLIAKPVQGVAVEEFMSLGETDILFIDSSHVARIGSDVLYELLEIVPRLQAGVAVHVHDIFLPGEYPRDWVIKLRRFWNEQYLLQAFLAFNREFHVLWGSSYMAMEHRDALQRAFPSLQPEDRPGSFWIQRRISKSAADVEDAATT